MTTPADIARAFGIDPTTAEYTPTSASRIPIESWGKDHFSTLAYLECRIVDHGGKLNHDQMRCDPDRHPAFDAAAKRRNALPGMLPGDRKYPTRLAGGVELADHDDYDCIDDMIAAGLVTATIPRDLIAWRVHVHEEMITGLVEAELMTYAVYALTERGQAIAGALRAHKGAGGNFARFTVPAELVTA